MSEDESMERDKGAFDAKGVVANSGKPRKAVTWAQQFIGWALRAPMERQAAAAVVGATVKVVTKEEREEFATKARNRALFGRGWWKRKPNRGTGNSNGNVPVTRRQRQIANGQISPLYRYADGVMAAGDRWTRVR